MKKTFLKIIFISSVVFLTVGLSYSDVFASTTDGVIDATYKYAWGENIGWINFGCDNCDVHITDTEFSGYALSETVGWIYLGDITNDGEGNLSGYAWGENIGWVNFAPTNGGVVINSSGEFTGSALSETVGWIIFGGDYTVKTDWRPQSVRPACNNGLDDDGDGKIDYPSDPGCSSLDDNDESDPVVASSGGGGLPSEAYSPPIIPATGFKILINNDSAQTDSRKVTLTLSGGSNTKMVWLSENPQFLEGFQIPYNSFQNQESYSFTLSDIYGTKTVYAKFCTQWGGCSDVVSDSIILIRKTPLVEEIKEIPVKVIEIIKETPQKITEEISHGIQEVVKVLESLVPEFLKPEETIPAEVIVEELVAQETPLALQNNWQLLILPRNAEFVLAPLPKAIQNLARKFPTLKKTLVETGIAKITDISKLKNIELTLPGLTERAGLPIAKVEPSQLVLPLGVPVADLSPAIKQQLPTEIVFAKTGGELIDFNIALSLGASGEPQQKINTISGKLLQLAVKPDQPVKSVKGYLVLKEKQHQSVSFDFSLNSLLSSLIFAEPVFARTQEEPVRVEEKLVLLEFEYFDLDGDGIYTAEIQSPVVEGEYEIITVLEFNDPELGRKEIRLTTVVDPEGYIYEKYGNKEIRVPGAIASLFWLNSATKQYELWPAEEYQQENPQITDVRGVYSFLVPEGDYYLKVEAPGYLSYDGKPFQVREGSGIHTNIELKTKYWWLKIFDWKTVLLVVVILLLLYNFYKDRVREKMTRK